jgi:hypothetical protein
VAVKKREAVSRLSTCTIATRLENSAPFHAVESQSPFGRIHLRDIRMQHPLQCECGTIKGIVHDPRRGNRVVCYCKDCQAFAHFLGKAKETLDDRGGSEVIQVLPRNVAFTQGIEALACMRLTGKGLLRWYAGCCKTPIGNTLDNFKISFIGLVHTCLETSDKPIEDSFGPVRAWVNTKGAKGNPKPKTVGVGRTILWFLANTLKARIDGSYKQTPLFIADKGTPITPPRVLSPEEHANVMNAVQAAAITVSAR